MDINTTVFDDLGTSVAEIIDKASERFCGIYVMDIESNKVIAIKSFYQKEFYDKPMVHEWDHNILEEVNKSMAPKYRALALVTFDRQHLRKKFTDMKQRSEFVYERNTGEWNSVNFQPLKIKNGECTCVLVTFVDITDSKNRIEEVAKQLELSRKDVQSSNWYFSMVAQDIYSWILKFDLLTGETSKIVFEDNEPKEVSLMDWDALYEKIFESIHPKDLEIAREKFSFQRLKEMNPGDVIEYTFRRYMDNKYQWYNVSIHLSKIEPSIAVAFARNITSSGFEINQIISKAEHDSLTDLFNIEKYANLLSSEYSELKSAGVIYVDIEGLSSLNEKYGRDFGDSAIKIVADSLRSVQDRKNLAFRCGDDEFMLICADATQKELEVKLQLARERFARLCDIQNVHFIAAFGSAWKESVSDIASVISEAVQDMRNHKSIEILR